MIVYNNTIFYKAYNWSITNRFYLFSCQDSIPFHSFLCQESYSSLALFYTMACLFVFPLLHPKYIHCRFYYHEQTGRYIPSGPYLQSGKHLKYNSIENISYTLHANKDNFNP